MKNANPFTKDSITRKIFRLNEIPRCFFQSFTDPCSHTRTHTHTYAHTPARAHLLRSILDSVQNRLAKSSFVHEVWASLVIPVCKQWPTEWPFETLHGLDRVKEASICTYVFRITITLSCSFYRDGWHHVSANINDSQDESDIYFSKGKLLIC